MTRHPTDPPARAVPLATEWERFVERSGLLATSALLVVIVSLTAARSHPTELVRSLAIPQLLLLLIVLGCVGVLAYRSGDQD